MLKKRRTTASRGARGPDSRPRLSPPPLGLAEGGGGGGAGLATLSTTEVIAARWKTTLQSRTAVATVAGSVIEPRRTSTLPATAARFSSRPVEKSSRTTTEWVSHSLRSEERRVGKEGRSRWA